MTAELIDAFNVTGAVGKIDAVSIPSSLAKIHCGIFFSRELRALVPSPPFPPPRFLRVLLLGNIDEEKRNTRRFHDGEPIVSRIPSRMCVGRGGFQDQDTARPPSSFRDSLATPFVQPPTFALAFYCRVAVLARIASVIRIFIAEIGADVRG